MGDSSLLLRPGTLWPALLEATRRAHACGAIRPIRTAQQFIDDGGVRFLVRKVSSLARKDEDRAARQAQEAAGAPVNPFLPCEPDLVVGDLSDSHRAVLNKFNVIDHHLLIVTRRFMDQETLLDADDFAALAVCMAEIDGLGFYNGGTAAGASQPHKHLQLVPLPLADTGPALPVEALFEAVRGVPGICRLPGLPFAHALSWLEPSLFAAPARTAAALLAGYREMLAAWSLSPIRSGGEAQRIKLVTELAKVRAAPSTPLTVKQPWQKGKRSTLYVLDEPTVGLHMADVEKLIRVLHRLADAGNTVVVIEHNLDVMAEADWIIDLGPEGGNAGGRIVAAGTPEAISQQSEHSHTARVLAPFLAQCRA